MLLIRERLQLHAGALQPALHVLIGAGGLVHVCMCVQVKDVGVDPDHLNPATRIYMTRVAQPWHIDSADLVGEAAASQ